MTDPERDDPTQKPDADEPQSGEQERDEDLPQEPRRGPGESEEGRGEGAA